MKNRLAIVFLASIPGALPQGADFAKKYPATLDCTPDHPAYGWVCEKGDAWSLDSFLLEQGTELRIELGPCRVVFGRNGTNVLWAVVLADKPGKLVTPYPGGGEEVSRIYLRFNPALVSKLFPAKTVKGNAPETAIPLAKWVCAQKASNSWQIDNLPTVPEKSSITIDLDTPQGGRRFYSVDTNQGTARHQDFFSKRPLPALPGEKVDREAARRAYDAVWKAFDVEYPMFGVKPKLDWEKAGARWRPVAEAATTTFELAGAINELVAETQDLHAWVKHGEFWLPGYNRPRPLNANYRASTAAVGRVEDTKKELIWGRTDDGIGYLLVVALSNPALPEAFDAALEKSADTWGMIVDLRFNGGGDEILAQKLAGRFLDAKKVYAKNRYRSGPKHDQLGDTLSREVEPRGPWRYEAPVVVLWGQKTMSSAESFAMMMEQVPGAVTMGERSAGSSGNPRKLELAGGIVVNVPRWLDLDVRGKPIDGVGHEPKVVIAAKPEEFTDKSDPVMAAALAHLRKIPEGARKPGKRP